MRGYLLKEENIVTGKGCFVQTEAAEHRFVTVFEDDQETGYFYAAEKDDSGSLSILDMVFIYDVESIPPDERKLKLSVIWSTDWQRCGLILDNTCHAVFDFRQRAGYNLTGFPEPILWRGHERILTVEMVQQFFS
jgi:hypothetical protein